MYGLSASMVTTSTRRPRRRSIRSGSSRKRSKLAGLELDQQIDVAVGICLAPDHRTEQGDSVNTQTTDLAFRWFAAFDDFVPTHSGCGHRPYGARNLHGREGPGSSTILLRARSELFGSTRLAESGNAARLGRFQYE